MLKAVNLHLFFIYVVVELCFLLIFWFPYKFSSLLLFFFFWFLIKDYLYNKKNKEKYLVFLPSFS